MFEIDRTEEFREYMICRILELQTQDQYTRDELLKKSTMELQQVFEDVK